MIHDLRFTIYDLRAGDSPSTSGCGILRGKRGWYQSTVGWATRLVLTLLLLTTTLSAEQRFPPPDFEGGHQLPITAQPVARGLFSQYLDVVVLAGSLAFATWLVHKKRSRQRLIGLSIFSLGYFGFYRKGCVCAIGSVQNVALALFDRHYPVPVGVLAFFVLPLVFTLLAGRSFCAGVCPHGALQDLVLIKPIKVPAWLEQSLSIVPYVYLGAGVLFAATGSAFVICEYDPFVPIFRLSGRVMTVLTGTALLVLGLFVGRPYCRFLCPYGALLKLAATVAKWRVRVTPNYCTQCRLCEASCPFGAMREPTTLTHDPAVVAADRRRLAWLLVLVPVLLAGGGWLGWRFSGPAAFLNPDVNLARRLVLERDSPPKTGTLSPDDLALERARQSPREILATASLAQHRFAVAGWIFGGFVGLVLALKLISVSIYQRRTDYEPDRGECFACARCFEYCPNELARR